MVTLLCFFLTLLASPFKSKTRLEAENAALRHQLIVLQRKVRGRVHFTNSDRLFFIQLYRWFPSILRLRFQSNGMEWATMAGRFPTPWREEKFSGGYVVRDATGQARAYLYARYARSTESEPSRPSN